MLDACFSSSISSRVLTTRARETAGQPLTMFRPELLEGLEGRHVEVVDADLLLLDLVLLEHFHHAVGHAAGHVRHRALGPLPGDGGPDAPFHPRQVDLGALQVGAGRLEQRRRPFGRHHGVADVDVVFPVALIRRGGVADVGAGEQDQRAEVVGLHLRLQLLQALLAQPVEVDAVLPVGAGLAVEAPRIPFMRLADEANIHPRCGVDFPLIPSHKISHHSPFVEVRTSKVEVRVSGKWEVEAAVSKRRVALRTYFSLRTSTFALAVESR